MAPGGSFHRERRRRGVLPATALGLLAAACAGKYSGAWDFAGQPGLLWDVKRYYETHAVEEYGRCRNPLIEGVPAASVLDETPERLVVRVRYYYRDAFRDPFDDCDELRGGVLRRSCVLGGLTTPCRGVGERTFTIDKRGETPEIATMTGERAARAGFGR